MGTLIDLLHVLTILSLLIAAIFGLVSAILFPPGRGSSISRAIAKNDKYFLYSGLLLSLLGAGFFSGLAFWLAPAYGLPTWAEVLVALSFVSLIGLAWTKAKDDSIKTRFNIHFAFGQVLGLCLIGLLLATVLRGHVNNNVGWLVWLTITFCTACYPLYVFVGRLRQHFLLFEIAFAGLLIASYLALAVVGPIH